MKFERKNEVFIFDSLFVNKMLQLIGIRICLLNFVLFYRLQEIHKSKKAFLYEIIIKTVLSTLKKFYKHYALFLFDNLKLVTPNNCYFLAPEFCYRSVPLKYLSNLHWFSVKKVMLDKEINF
jgi:hypothetical protein